MWYTEQTQKHVEAIRKYKNDLKNCYKTKQSKH